MPAERIAPLGTPEMAIERLSELSRSVSAEVMLSGIAESSVPEAGLTESVGASATAATATGS